VIPRVVSAEMRAVREVSGSQAVQYFAKLLVNDGDGVWRDLTNLTPDGLDWLVSAEWGGSIDQPVMSATFTLIREQYVPGAGLKSLAPQIAASPYNKDASGAYNPLVNPGRSIRLLTSTIVPGTTPGASWNRVFDGKIDACDPGNDDGTMVVRCRDRGAWLQDTIIEVRRQYTSTFGSAIDAGVVIQRIINDNNVPSHPVLSIPTPFGWFLPAKDWYQDYNVSVLDAIRAIAAQIGTDIRYLFLTPGDVDPVLVWVKPNRTKTTPDYAFGPNEYTAVTKSELSDADVKNAITVGWTDALGTLQTVTRTNDASIQKFKRRFGRVDNVPNIDTTAEAQALGDAIVSDLSSPVNQHAMENFYCWYVQVSDLVQYLSNNVMYDAAFNLAITSYKHALADGHGTTTVEGRGTPAGGYKSWLNKLSTSAQKPVVVVNVQLVTQSDTTIQFQVIASTIGDDLNPAVGLAQISSNPVATLIVGAPLGNVVANNSQWTFAKPAYGAGQAQVQFFATLDNGLHYDAVITVPIPPATPQTVNAPTITPNVSAQEFDIAWTVTTPPPSPTYQVYYRATPTSDWQSTASSASLTAVITQAMHGRHFVASGGYGVATSFQAYVVQTDGSGNTMTSPTTTVTYYDLGNLAVDGLTETPDYTANQVKLDFVGHGFGIDHYEVWAVESAIDGNLALPSYRGNVAGTPANSLSPKEYVFTMGKNIESGSWPQTDTLSFYIVAKDASGTTLATSATVSGTYGWMPPVPPSPSVDAPVVNPNATTNNFEVSWHGFNPPASVLYYVWWRLGGSGSFHQAVYTLTTSKNIPQKSGGGDLGHGYDILPSPPTNAAFQCYVTMYDVNAGAVVATSPTTSQPFNAGSYVGP
jgi:hypothetical protein